MSNTRLTIQTSIDPKYRDVINFYSQNASIGKFFNACLDLAQRDKSFKFKILNNINKNKSFK